jgi:hypothetical protein
MAMVTTRSLTLNAVSVYSHCETDSSHFDGLIPARRLADERRRLTVEPPKSSKAMKNKSLFLRNTQTILIVAAVSLAGLWMVSSADCATVWDGPLISYTQPASDPTQETNQDRLTTNVWLTRGPYKGLFNVASESSYTNDFSPEGTEWAIGELSDYTNLTYTSWEGIIGSDPRYLLGKDCVVHLITNDIYLSIRVTYWARGQAGYPSPLGGFAYIRSTPHLTHFPAPASVTWSSSPTNSDWYTPWNWTNRFAPGPRDLVFFGASNKSNIDMSPDYASVDSVTFNSGAPAFVINGDGVHSSLTLTGGGMTNNSSNLQTMDYGINVILSGAQTINTAASNITFYGGISGGGNLTKVGTYNLTISDIYQLFSDKPYTGDTTVLEGTLSLSQPCLNTNSTVTVTNGAVLNLAFLGTNTVNLLVLGGTTYTNGVFNSTNSANLIAGTGSLLVDYQLIVPRRLESLSYSGGVLHLSWPAGEGWKLQRLTTSLTGEVDTNWSDITDGSISSTNIPVDLTLPWAFFRLMHP